MDNSVKLREFEYVTKEIDHQINYIYTASQISNNQQFLAYGGSSGILKIYDIKSEIIFKELKIFHEIIVCQFTCDSSLIFVGCNEGNVYGFDCLLNFKIIFRKKIHSDVVSNIRTIRNQYLMTCSIDKSIIKTSLKTGQQIFKLVGHLRQILAIDYNYIDDMIVSGSFDKSIKVWDCMKRIITIDKAQSHPDYIQQVQLINNNSQLLTLDLNSNIYKWKIDLIKKELTKILELQSNYEVISFHQCSIKQNLLLICDSNFKILNQQGKCIQIMQLQEGEYYSIYESRQLDQLEYIQLKKTVFVQDHYNSTIELTKMIPLD